MDKKKVIILAAILVVLLVGASVTYALLGKNVSPDNAFVPGGQEQNAEGSDDADYSDDVNGEGTFTTDKTGDRSSLELAPDFTMTDSKGNEIKLSDLRGKPVVLNFWASWCPPCKGEMPEFNVVYEELGSEVEFVMLNLLDTNETPDDALAFVQSQGYSFPVYFDLQQEGALAYNVRAIPATVLIDKDGCLVAVQPGALDEKTLREGIALIR
ncbi:MAG: TlpA family protein disulfide reductase [Coriobacteriales bacterium]|nr:TlpA family protein disulfide reductase [Coriobacteriales bacterium]